MVSSTTLRVGVLGTGRIGALHAELLAHRVPGAALTTVYDVDAAAAAAVGERFGAVTAGSAEQLLRNPAVDAVAICSSTDTHVDLVVAAAAAGKPILCEKPISLDLAEVDRALTAVRRADVLFMVGFNRRFDPAHHSVRDAVATGVVGDVHLVRISSRDPEPPPLAYARVSGGLFLDQTIHDFDMAAHVAGSAIAEVFARGTVRITPELRALGDVDTAAIMLVHDNGALTLIDNSRRAVYGYDQRIEAFGSNGLAASENPATHTGVVRSAAATTTPPLPHFFIERYTPSYVREWEAFVAAVQGGGPSPVPGVDGRAALVAGLAAGRSLREGRPVRVDEIA